MKKGARKRQHDTEPAPDDMLAHYDFHGGVRGKHAARYAEGTNVVVLDEDVAEIFRTPESVNEALRTIARLVRAQGIRRAS